MKRILLLIFVLVTITSCRTFDKRATMRGYVKRDSLKNTSQTIVIDSIFNVTKVIEGDSLIQALKLACDSAGNVYIAALQQKDGKILELEQELENNILNTKVIYRDRKVEVPGKIRYVTNIKTKTKYVTTNKVPKFWKIVGWIGIITIILIVLYIVYRIILKRIRR